MSLAIVQRSYEAFARGDMAAVLADMADDIEWQQAQGIIKQVNDAGVAMLVVEQNANVSLSIADRGYVLSTGRIVLEGKAADLLEDEGLRKAYLGR